jgi:CYTH domain-containing protein
MPEIKKTYLAKQLPEDLRKEEHVEIEDIYVPGDVNDPRLRLRREGDSYSIEKRLEDNEAATDWISIELSHAEFEVLRGAKKAIVRKNRYPYQISGQEAEFHVYTGPLDGLVLVIIKSSSGEDVDSFSSPEYCLAEVTGEEFIKGGQLAGKSYIDITSELNRYGYEKL